MSQIAHAGPSGPAHVALEPLQAGDRFSRLNRPIRRWEWTDWRALWSHRSLLYFLVWREIRAKYQQTVVGLGWVILYPLLQTLIYSLVFGVLLQVPSDGVPYPLFVLSGIITWHFFSQAVGDISRSLLTQKGLLQKLYFPRLILPVASLMTTVVDFLAALAVVILAGLLAGSVPTWRYLLLPAIILAVSLTASSLGLWLAPLNVRYRDVQRMLGLVLRLWLFLSPVVYSRRLVPPGPFEALYSLNPLVPILDGTRWVLFGYGEVNWPAALPSLVIVLLLNVTGLFYFERESRSAADLV